MVCWWPWAWHLGWCKFCSHQSITGAWWSCHGGCKLLRKAEGHAAWCCAKRCKHDTDVEVTILHLHTVCVHKWITDTLMGKARVRTRAASEMLIRRRLDALASQDKEYGLSVDAVLVRSEHNRADSLTRVTQQWLDLIKKAVEPPSCASAVSPNKHNWLDKVNPTLKQPPWCKANIVLR